MNEKRYVLVYHDPEDDAPTSIRTWTLDEAQRRSRLLNAANTRQPDSRDDPYGRWTIHELSDELNP